MRHLKLLLLAIWVPEPFTWSCQPPDFYWQAITFSRCLPHRSTPPRSSRPSLATALRRRVWPHSICHSHHGRVCSTQTADLSWRQVHLAVRGWPARGALFTRESLVLRSQYSRGESCGAHGLSHGPRRRLVGGRTRGSATHSAISHKRSPADTHRTMRCCPNGGNRASSCMFAEPSSEWVGGFATPGFACCGSVNNLLCSCI